MTERGRRLSHANGIKVPDRWMAEISYRTDRPTRTVVFEEICDLDEIVELGPDWREIEQITITLNRS